VYLKADAADGLENKADEWNIEHVLPLRSGRLFSQLVKQLKQVLFCWIASVYNHHPN
jgi:hypothetical protein